MTTVTINGATRLYGIIGNPIAQVRSPETFTPAFAASGVNAVMLPIQVLPDAFDLSVRGLMALGNLDGFLVTVPYKARMVAYATRLGDTARTIGAVNALRREADGSWSADIFDGKGFVTGARRKGHVLSGRRAAQFGAGGAGSAIACELVAAGVQSLAIIDIVRERAEKLAEALKRTFPAADVRAAEAVPPGSTMIVNASTVGMKPGDGLPAEIGPVAAGTLIGDVINTDAHSPIIALAAKSGCPYVTGKDMHAGQGEALLAFFAAATRAPSGVTVPSH
jgi:shikimate dehydrogenase